MANSKAERDSLVMEALRREGFDELYMLVATLLRAILTHQPQVQDELLAILNEYPTRDSDTLRTRQRCREIINGMAVRAAKDRKTGRTR